MSDQSLSPVTKPSIVMPWQFSLRTLLLLSLGIGLWMAVASWSLRYTHLIAIWFGYFCFLYPFRDPGKKHFTIMEWIPLVLTILLFFYLLAFPDYGKRLQHAGIIQLQILNSQNKHPVDKAQIQLYPNGLIYLAASGSSNAQGKCELTASFSAIQQEGGWGRKRTTLFLTGTYLIIIAPGYEDLTVDWNELSEETTFSVNALPDAPVVIHLTPSE